jgi:hypothetical protein
LVTRATLRQFVPTSRAAFPQMREVVRYGEVCWCIDPLVRRLALPHGKPSHVPVRALLVRSRRMHQRQFNTAGALVEACRFRDQDTSIATRIA